LFGTEDAEDAVFILGFDYTSWYKARVTDLGCMKSKYPNIDVHILAFQSATPHVSIYWIVATSVLVYYARQNASEHVKYVITIN
jgi:hypothetical protein